MENPNHQTKPSDCGEPSGSPRIGLPSDQTDPLRKSVEKLISPIPSYKSNHIWGGNKLLSNVQQRTENLVLNFETGNIGFNETHGLEICNKFFAQIHIGSFS
jgi:hypothetical protein